MLTTTLTFHTLLYSLRSIRIDIFTNLNKIGFHNQNHVMLNVIMSRMSTGYLIINPTHPMHWSISELSIKSVTIWPLEDSKTMIEVVDPISSVLCTITVPEKEVMILFYFTVIKTDDCKGNVHWYKALLTRLFPCQSWGPAATVPCTCWRWSPCWPWPRTPPWPPGPTGLCTSGPSRSPCPPTRGGSLHQIDQHIYHNQFQFNFWTTN